MKITLKRSLIGTRQDQRATVHALGLRRIGDTRVVQDTPDVRGMVDKVAFLLEIEDGEEHETE